MTLYIVWRYERHERNRKQVLEAAAERVLALEELVERERAGAPPSDTFLSGPWEPPQMHGVLHSNARRVARTLGLPGL